MTQNLNHYEKILSRTHSNYLAQISIEMTDANNQINEVLSKLTALGTILIPMNLITGISQFGLSPNCFWLTNVQRYLGYERTRTRPRRRGLQVVRLHRRSARDDRSCRWFLCI